MYVARNDLIVGRKGSGKTAIFKRLLDIHEPEYFCFGHTFSDYPWHYHDKQARIGIPDFDKYTHSWKYLILLTLAKIILNQDQSLPHDDRGMEAMAAVERFVVDTGHVRAVGGGEETGPIPAPSIARNQGANTPSSPTAKACPWSSIPSRRTRRTSTRRCRWWRPSPPSPASQATPGNARTM